MAINPINATCWKCGEKFSGAPKRSFLGFQKLKCESCGETVLYPLTNGYRIIWWVILISMLLSLANTYGQGGWGFPGVLGIASIIAIIRDFSIRKRVEKVENEAYD